VELACGCRHASLANVSAAPFGRKKSDRLGYTQGARAGSRARRGRGRSRPRGFAAGGSSWSPRRLVPSRTVYGEQLACKSDGALQPTFQAPGRQRSKVCLSDALRAPVGPFDIGSECPGWGRVERSSPGRRPYPPQQDGTSARWWCWRCRAVSSSVRPDLRPGFQIEQRTRPPGRT
jgi:hypothetical protein